VPTKPRHFDHVLVALAPRVDQDWLLELTADYVVAPTGATGVVNPTNRGSS
jgi:hypothetical protein